MGYKRHDRINDGSTNPPRLLILQSWWAMIGVGSNGEEWSVERKFAEIAQAGFAGIMGRLPIPANEELWKKLMKDYGFSYGLHTFPSSRAELTAFMEEALPLQPDFINAHIMDSFVVGKVAMALIEDLLEEAGTYPIPFYVETHRGRITQDLHRTIEYVQSIPDLRLTIDLSHYVIAGEMEQISDQARALFDQLLARTSCIHGRISNGQQVQINIGPKGEHSLVAAYVELWSKGMAYWLEDAVPGDILPVLPELGPPPYALTYRSNRWEQALVLKGLLEQAWDNAIKQRNSKT